jgi:carbonic anhydrase
MNYSSTTSGTCNVYSPINISQRHSYGKCVDKCDFSFKYDNSSIKLTNKGTYLNITCDDTNNSPVTYNTRKYKVSDIRIYAPSLHTYNGAHMPCEILIIHTPVLGGNQLFVSIPVIKTSGSVNIGSTIFNAVIKNALANIPAEGNESRVDNIKNFNLNAFVPKKEYYYYTGVNFLEQPCSTTIDVICYLPYVANIGINDDVLSRLSSIIQTSNIIPKEYSETDTPKLYLNSTSFRLGSESSGEMIMDCQPYDDSAEPTETTDVVVETGTTDDASATDILNSDWFQLIVGSIGFFVILCILNGIFGLFEHKAEISESDLAKGGSMSFLSFFQKK